MFANNFLRPDETAVEKFRIELVSRGLTVITRWSKGQSISSACGQLAILPENLC